MSAHDYCPGHAADGSDAPTGDASDLGAVECHTCAPDLTENEPGTGSTQPSTSRDREGPTEDGVRLIAALGGDTTVNPTPPAGMWIAACAPTDDPDYWRMIEACGDDCHHPVHAFGHPERMRHLVPTEDAVHYRHEPLRGIARTP